MSESKEYTVVSESLLGRNYILCLLMAGNTFDKKWSLTLANQYRPRNLRHSNKNDTAVSEST